MSAPSIEAFTSGNFFSASQVARTKNDMKPSLTPWVFSNCSLCCCRSAMTACISTSLKVVRIAAVCWTCCRRSAMRARNRVMGTRRSSRSPVTKLGAGMPAGAERFCFKLSSTSCFRMCPFSPVAVTSSSLKPSACS